MTRKTTLFFVLILTPLWLFVLFLVFDLAFRVYDDIDEDHGRRNILNIIDTYRAADDHAFQEVNRVSYPPDTVHWRAPNRDRFSELDEPGRYRFAQERKELILTCDSAGKIINVYPCNVTPELAMISRRITPGGSLADLLPPAELADAFGAVQQVIKGEEPCRDYEIPLDAGNTELMEFNVRSLSGQSGVFVIFLGSSRYIRFMRAYRPNIYRQDWYLGQFNHSEFWTNSRGFRDHEITLPKPAGEFRILCVGGSTTVEGPHNDLTYPKLLESLLKEHFGTNAIEVINCGVDGMAFPGEFERMDDWLALQPDLIIHYNIINNATSMIENAVAEAGLYKGKEGGIRTILEHSRIISTAFSSWFYPSTDVYTQGLEEHAIEPLEKMNLQARAFGASLAAASFAIPDPSRISLDERRFLQNTYHIFGGRKRGDLKELRRFIDEYNRLVREFCTREDVLYIPVAENILGGVETFADICHLRLPGIRQKAEIMFETLKEVIAGDLGTLNNSGNALN